MGGWCEVWEVWVAEGWTWVGGVVCVHVCVVAVVGGGVACEHPHAWRRGRAHVCVCVFGWDACVGMCGLAGEDNVRGRARRTCHRTLARRPSTTTPPRTSTSTHSVFCHQLAPRARANPTPKCH